MEIITDLIPSGRKNRPGKVGSMQYISIHNTGNTDKGADALRHALYLKGDAAANAQVSWHYTVDDKRAVQHLPVNEIGYHAGDGASGPGNNKSIGIEVCVNADGDLLTATNNAAELCAGLCKKYGILPANIVQHNHWSGKNCPQWIRSSKPYNWAEFIRKVENYMNEIDKPQPSEWAKEAWEWAKENGIMDGTNPQGTLTREQLATVLFRLLGKGWLHD